MNRQIAQGPDIKIPAPFQITFSDGEVAVYPNDKEGEYYEWLADQGGTLYIYKQTVHIQFSAKLEHTREAAYAMGTWKSAEVIKADDEG